MTKLRPVSHFRRRETADARPHPIARAVTPRDAMTADDIVVNVRLLPDEEDAREHPHLTRFQRAKRSEVTGRTLRLRCSPGDTVAALKRLVEGAYGRRARLPSPPVASLASLRVVAPRSPRPADPSTRPSSLSPPP